MANSNPCYPIIRYRGRHPSLVIKFPSFHSSNPKERCRSYARPPLVRSCLSRSTFSSHPSNIINPNSSKVSMLYLLTPDPFVSSNSDPLWLCASIPPLEPCQNLSMNRTPCSYPFYPSIPPARLYPLSLDITLLIRLCGLALRREPHCPIRFLTLGSKLLNKHSRQHP